MMSQDRRPSGWVGFVLLLAASVGCSGSPGTQASRAEQPDPGPAPAKAVPVAPAEQEIEETASPEPASPKPVPVKLADRVDVDCLKSGKTLGSNQPYLDELAVVATGSLGGMGDLQHSQRARWIALDESGVGALQDAGVGESQPGAVPIFTIGTDGVKEEEAEVVLLGGERPSFEGGSGGFRLATQGCKPPAEAALTMQRLDPPGPGSDAAAKWVERKEGEPQTAVGEVRGKFGAGVDRFVVVRPAQYWYDKTSGQDEPAEPSLEEQACPSEFVIAMKGNSVTSAMPLGARVPGQRKGCAEGEPAHLPNSGIELLARVDLDQDGREELLWFYEKTGLEPATANVALSMHKRSKVVAVTLSAYGYAACDAYLDASECGRAPTKANKGRPYGVTDDR